MTTLGKIAVGSRQMSEAAHSTEGCETHLDFRLIQESTKPLTPLQEFRPSFPSAIFVETRDSGTCWDELDCGIGSRVGEANFRLARQPPTIVTWAERPFYFLPLVRPSGFVNATAFERSRWRGGRYACAGGAAAELACLAKALKLVLS